MAGLIAGVVLLDVGVQSGHVANQTRIYALDANARSRLNTVYMFCYFSGGSLGSWLGAICWNTKDGWQYVHWSRGNDNRVACVRTQFKNPGRATCRRALKSDNGWTDCRIGTPARVTLSAEADREAVRDHHCSTSCGINVSRRGKRGARKIAVCRSQNQQLATSRSVRRRIDLAKRDFRDVLMSAGFGEP